MGAVASCQSKTLAERKKICRPGLFVERNQQFRAATTIHPHGERPANEEDIGATLLHFGRQC